MQQRNLRALLALGVIIATVAIAGGGLILALGYPKPEITQPLWKLGQYALIIGSVNLCVYAGMFWQLKKLLRDIGSR